MHVGVGFVGGGDVVFGDGEDEVHVQHIAIPLNGLFGVFAAIGNVVNLVYFHGVLRLFAAEIPEKRCKCNEIVSHAQSMHNPYTTRAYAI